MLVPVRPMPVMNTGSSTGCSRISGCSLLRLGHLQPHDERADELRPGENPADQVQVGLVLEVVDQDAERLAPLVATEVVQPGLGDRGVEEGRLVERDQEPDVAVVGAHPVELGDPLGALLRLPCRARCHSRAYLDFDVEI